MDGEEESYEATSNRKRPRPESWSSTTNQSPDDDESVCLQTPHTLRLLKLVEEGTLEHARLAATHLTQLEASPLVLWDLLGRLQALLLSEEWSTRTHASLAMQGVGQHIPSIDQCEFMSSNFDGGVLWLTVSDVAKELDTVLTEGRELLAASDDMDDNVEEHLLHTLDDARDEHAEDFVEQRVRLQREILAQRLGLGGVVRAVGGSVLEDVITKDDLLMNQSTSAANPTTTSHRKDPKSQNACKRGTESASIRALLVLEMMQQQEGTCERGATSHKNPQTLLATELIYRVFDPSWHVRHGSLLGILALLRAWKSVVVGRMFGIWPHDILARCLCVLSLDRFGDYGGQSPTGETDIGGDGVVAPVREMSGQLLSVLWTMAPDSIQNDCLEVLVRMSKRNEWEIRHGALLALKYIVVMLSKNVSNGTQITLVDTRIELIVRVAQTYLVDKMEDVQSVAAQILLTVLSGSHEEEIQRMELIKASCLNLWSALDRVQSVSSCVTDFVSLFSSMICADCSSVCRSLASQSGKEAAIFEGIVLKLLELLDLESPTVRLSALKAVGGIAGPFVAMIESGDDSTELAACYWHLMIRIFDLFASDAFGMLNVNGGGESTTGSLVRVRDRTWEELVRHLEPVLMCSNAHRNEILIRLVGCYVKSQRRIAGGAETAPTRPIADALARFLIEMKTMHDCHLSDGLNSFLETTFYFLLRSSCVRHCESGCVLYRALCSRETGCRSICRELLHQLLLGTPPCLAVRNMESPSFVLSSTNIIDAYEREMKVSLELVLESNDACADVEAIWNTALRSQQLTMLSALENECTSATVNTTGMRVYAMISGAIVAGGKSSLPPKLTPLIRSLMTSLKSEKTHDRLSMTCESLALLLQSLCHDENETHLKAKTKIVENVCVMMTCEHSSSRTGASRVLELYIAKMPNETLETLPSVWKRLQILKESSAPAAALEESLGLLKAICKAMNRGTALFCHVTEELMNALVPIACTCSFSSARTTATDIVASLCKTDPELAMDACLPFILASLSDHENDARRLGSLCLLQSIIEEVGTDVCPFVRSLLPITMTLMTDSLEDIAKKAAHSFAALVRVAPLVKKGSRRHWEKVLDDDYSSRVIDHLIHGERLPPCILPSPILQELRLSGVSLRPYQLEGIAWLQFLQQVKLNGALCDDMGLGKTLQALVGIALSHHHAVCDDPSARPVSLVVCPSTLVGHWLAEIRKFFPKNQILRGSSTMFGSKSKEWSGMGECNVIVTSYIGLRRDVRRFSTKQWHHCVLDEGHLLKNPQTATAIATRRIRAHHKLILTGTPVQNRVHELWAVFDFLMPNFLGSQSWFTKNFARPISSGQLQDASAGAISLGMEKLKLLHQQILPFILRREKEQVLKELPPKCIADIPCTLSKEQQELYESFCAGPEAKRAILALQQSVAKPHRGTNPNDSNVATASKFGGDALRSLLYLRLLCTHPSLVASRRQGGRNPTNGASNRRILDSRSSYAHLDSSGKLQALNELLRSSHICGEELTAADNDTSALYCDFNDNGGSGDDMSNVLNLPDGGPVSGVGGTTVGGISDGAKGSKFLIFAQFTQSLDVVEQFLFQPHMPSLRYLRLDGNVPPDRRGDLVERFNRDDSIKVMLLTTRVGGLGLNLTGASTVVFLEHDFNPHADLQAMDRVHRIGQTKTVNVYRLITQNTIEEKIMKLQEAKMAMSKAIVNSDNSTMYSMGTDRLLDIFTFQSGGGESKARDKNQDNLDSLDTYSADDYACLSVQEFLKSFESSPDD